jgi:hypothetical protein
LRAKRRITIKSHSVLILPRHPGMLSALCDACGERAEFVPLEICGLPWYDAEMLYQMVERGKIHYMNRSEGQPLICLQSALKLLARVNESSGDPDG